MIKLDPAVLCTTLSINSDHVVERLDWPQYLFTVWRCATRCHPQRAKLDTDGRTRLTGLRLIAPGFALGVAHVCRCGLCVYGRAVFVCRPTNTAQFTNTTNAHHFVFSPAGPSVEGGTVGSVGGARGDFPLFRGYPLHRRGGCNHGTGGCNHGTGRQPSTQRGRTGKDNTAV